MAELTEEYIARMEEVLAVYEKPLSEQEPVVCMDEKPVVLHADIRPSIPMRPGRMARHDSEYQRCGTANVFCGVQPKAGRHFTKVTRDRSSPQFADYLLAIAEHYPAADTIHLVMDNRIAARPWWSGWREGRKLAVGALHGALHAQTRKLAEPGRDRNQPVLPAVSGAAPDPLVRRPTAGSPRLEPEHEP